jgi:homoserine dehydrogenase
MILRIAMIGFGNVGQEFASMLLAKREWLLRNRGLDAEVLAIYTKSRGALLSKRALEVDRCLELVKAGKSLSEYGPEATSLSPVEMISKCDADVMIELSPLNVESGQPAIDHVVTAIDNGMDVVTANKGPIAFEYRRLRNLARSKGVHFRFEGTVMDGTPVFNLVEKTLQGCEILGLEGILNSTSNFVLTEMASGKTVEQAVRAAQAGGFAEADPSLDLEGWDAAAKITALANVLMDADEMASGLHKKFKLIARAEAVGEAVRLSVKPEMIGADSPFWSVDGTSSALTIRTDLMGDLTIVETNPRVTQTAYAIFSDILSVLDSIRAGTAH